MWIWTRNIPIFSGLSSLKETVEVPLPPDFVVTIMSPLSFLACPTRHTILLADIHSAVRRQLCPQIVKPGKKKKKRNILLWIQVSFEILQCKFIYDATGVLHKYITLHQSPIVNYSQGITNTFFRYFLGDFTSFVPVTIHETQAVLSETYCISSPTFGLLWLLPHVVQ